MNYFLQFLDTKEYLPYVLSSYCVAILILAILIFNSYLRNKKLIKQFLNLKNK